MPPKKRKGFGSEGQDPAAASSKRWSADTAAAATAEWDNIVDQLDADEAAEQAAAADLGAAPMAPVTRRASLEGDQGEQASPVYREPQRGEYLWDDLGGHADPGKSLRQAVSTVWQAIEQAANPSESDHPNIQTKRDELIAALFDRTEVNDAMVRMEKPTLAHQVIADGVSCKLEQMREAHVHKGEYGRVAHNAVMQAAVCRVGKWAKVRILAIAETLRVAASTVYRAVGRDEITVKRGDIVILDPRRKRRKDATSFEDIAAIQNFWASNTRPSPDAKPLAVMRTVDGEKVQHGIHWQEYTGTELYSMFIGNPESPTIGREVFRLNKPYFIRKPVWRGSLCPKCHVWRLMREGLTMLLEMCVDESNSCSCSFCAWHKSAARESARPRTAGEPPAVPYPPQSSSRTYEALFCAKKAAPEGSGFKGTMPCYDIACMRKCLIGKQESFIDGTGNNPALLEPVPDACQACANQFPLQPPPECSFAAERTEKSKVSYMHYVKTPRLGRTEATDREDLQEVTAYRREFLEDTVQPHLSVMCLHQYTADMQGEVSEIITERKHTPDNAHMLLGIDFAMNHTAIPKEELKQEFWDRTQVSLHPWLAYHDWLPQYGELSHPGGKPRAQKMMQTHVYLSDDPKHDTAYVDDNFRNILPIFHLQRSKAGIPPLRHITIHVRAAAG
jgi:hypothetical protein